MRGAVHRFSSRLGGVSGGPFAEANLSLRVGDDPIAVQENRRRLLSAAGLERHRLVTTRQVHGARVVRLGGSAGSVRPETAWQVEADGMVTTEPGLALLVGTADCLPVVLVGPTAVGVLHVGWRGLAGGVVEAGAEAMRQATPAGGEVRAHLGPAIRPCHFPVGADVWQQVVRRHAAAAAATPAGEPALDLAVAAAEALGSSGIRVTAASRTCTFESTHHFSARRDGVTGCQGAVVALR